MVLVLAQAAKPAPAFKTTLTLAEMTGRQAVVDTSAGAFVIDLRPDLAPNHVGYFMKLARSGAYDGTVFHRVIRHGIIQGGDPLSKDPAKAKQVRDGRSRRAAGGDRGWKARPRRGLRRDRAGQA